MLYIHILSIFGCFAAGVRFLEDVGTVIEGWEIEEEVLVVRSAVEGAGAVRPLGKS